MNKSEVLKAVITQLEQNLERLKTANLQAKESANDSESKAETKWDTSGLEASYLARGYARQFEETVKQLKILRAFGMQHSSHDTVGMGSMVLAQAGDYKDWMFLLPCCGGMELNLKEMEITVITPESPVGRSLLNMAAGDTYILPNGSSGKILDVV